MATKPQYPILRCRPIFIAFVPQKPLAGVGRIIAQCSPGTDVIQAIRYWRKPFHYLEISVSPSEEALQNPIEFQTCAIHMIFEGLEVALLSLVIEKSQGFSSLFIYLC